jgi:hypothetical protein
LIHYWPVTIGYQVFSAGDILWLFLPIRTELSRAIAEWRLPLWTPALQAGFPLFAEGEIAALYPLNLIFHRLFYPALALSYTILFNVVFASLGMYALVRSLGIRVAGAFLAGFIFSAGGFFIAHLSHSPHLAVAAWLPWLVFFQRKYFVASSKKHALIWFLSSSLSIALFLLAGFPQFALFNIGVFNLCAFLSPLIWNGSRLGLVETFHQSVRAVLVSMSATLLGIGVAAVQLIPTIELIGLSIREQEMTKAFFTSYSLEPSALSQFITPFWRLGMPEAANMEFWAYVGVLPFCLALSAIFLKRDPRTLSFFIFASLMLLLALGGNTPVYEWLYNIPIFNRLRVPARFLLLFTFAVAILAAIGLDELQNRARLSVHRSRARFSLIVLVGAVLLGFQIYLVFGQPVEYWLAVWQWLPVLLGLGTLATFTLVKWLPQDVWVSLILVLSLLDLATFSVVFRSTLTRMSSPSDLIQVSRTVQAMDTRDPLYRSHYTKPPMTEAAIRAILFTNLPIIYGKQGVGGYLPSLAIRRNQKYIDEMSLGMRNLIGMRYYLLPLEMPPWWDEYEPDGGLTPDVLGAQHKIPATRVTQIEITSYADQIINLSSGQLAGEMMLTVETGQTMTLPIRLGVETADWAYDSVARVEHDKPPTQLSFPAYLKSTGRAFDGHKYVARYQVAQNSVPLVVTSVGVRSFLPVGGLNIERVLLIDDAGRSVSLAGLWYRNDLALAFRSHAAAMWENRDALPRAFVVHQAEIVNGDDALERLKAPNFPYTKLVVLSDVPASALTETAASSANDVATVVEYKSERVVANVKMDSPGYLLLTDSWCPGWGAGVDGKEAPLYRADYIFRAVPLSSGQHIVIFEYHPASLYWGTVISGFSLFLCVVLAIYNWKIGKGH